MTTTTTVLSWHGKQELRDRIVARMRQHHADDAIIQSVYQVFAPGLALGYRGCAIGCLLDKQPSIIEWVCDRDGEGREVEIGTPYEPEHGWHGEVEHQFGIPYGLALIIDGTFEDLPAGEASDFALAVVEAIPVGVDLRPVIAEAGDSDAATDDEARWYADRLIELLTQAGAR